MAILGDAFHVSWVLTVWEESVYLDMARVYHGCQKQGTERIRNKAYTQKVWVGYTIELNFGATPNQATEQCKR